MYLKNKRVGRGRTFSVGGTIRKEMNGKMGSMSRVPELEVSAISLGSCVTEKTTVVSDRKRGCML